MPSQTHSTLDSGHSTPPSNDEVLVRAEGVSKKFCRSLKKSLWYGVCDIAGELLPGRKRRETRDEGRELSDRSAQDISRSPLDAGLSTAAASALDSSCSAKALDSGPSPLDSTHGLRAGEFFAVKDVSFELRRGECLGLIGHNGAGKTTLLKMLNGLIKPDAGSITMRGRVGALIALGAGFNPILTGACGITAAHFTGQGGNRRAGKPAGRATEGWPAGCSAGGKAQIKIFTSMASCSGSRKRKSTPRSTRSSTLLKILSTLPTRKAHRQAK